MSTFASPRQSPGYLKDKSPPSQRGRCNVPLCEGGERRISSFVGDVLILKDFLGKNDSCSPYKIVSLDRRVGKWEKVCIPSGKRQYFQVKNFSEKTGQSCGRWGRLKTAWEEVRFPDIKGDTSWSLFYPWPFEKTKKRKVRGISRF
jgi:hypothetical protein